MPAPDPSPPLPPSARPPAPLPRWLAPALVAALAVGAVLPAALRPDHVIGDGVDLFGTFWFYWFIDRCARLGQTPAFTDLMFHPLGKDIFAHTGANFVDAVASIPFQRAFGFPAYQPWFVAAVLAGNGLTFWPLAREVIGRDRAGSVLATLLYTVNPFVLFECMAGRITQATLWFLPGALWGALRIGLPGRAGWGAAAVTGACVALQAWTYWFFGWFLALGLAWLLIVRLARPEGRPRGRVLAGHAAAGLVCLALVSPAILAMRGAAAAGEVPGLQEATGSWLALPTGAAGNLASTLHGLVLMERHGQPMLTTWTWSALALAGVALGPQRLRWTGMAVVVGLFAIGPAWPRQGAPPLPMPHYLIAYHGLPFVDRLWFPYRLVAMAFPALALGAGLALERAGARAGARGRWAAAALILGLALAEQRHNLAWPLVHRGLAPPQIYREIGARGGGLIELPLGLARVSIAFQPVHEQPVFGGMAENAPMFHPPGYAQQLGNALIRALDLAVEDPTAPSPRVPAKAVDALRAQGFRWVVLDRQYVDADVRHTRFGRKAGDAQRGLAPFLAANRVVGLLGPPAAAEGALLVWDLGGGDPWPDGLRPTPDALLRRTWPLDDMPEYEELMRARGRLPTGP
jgi:hypothetical protein